MYRGIRRHSLDRQRIFRMFPPLFFQRSVNPINRKEELFMRVLRSLRLSFCAVVVLVGTYVFLCSYCLPQGSVATTPQVVREIHQRDKRFPLINPLVDVEPLEIVTERVSRSMKKAVGERIKKEDKRTISRVSVWFRDLNNGPTFGINEHDYYAAASLLKVPCLISYLRWADEEPDLMGRRLLVENADNHLQYRIPPSRLIQQGEYYPVRELLERMIVYSDNSALFVLLNYMHKQYPTLGNVIYQDLGVQLKNENHDFLTTVKMYAAHFRILYNASYVSRMASQTALGWLTKTEFRDGLRAGVPDDVVVAHKHGERTFLKGDKEIQRDTSQPEER